MCDDNDDDDIAAARNDHNLSTDEIPDAITHADEILYVVPKVCTNG